MYIYTKIVKKFADHKNPATLAANYRRRRFDLFLNLIEQLEGPPAILDVGGTEVFWNRMVAHSFKHKVILLNKFSQTITRPNFFSLIGDAREMNQFSD